MITRIAKMGSSISDRAGCGWAASDVEAPVDAISHGPTPDRRCHQLAQRRLLEGIGPPRLRQELIVASAPGRLLPRKGDGSVPRPDAVGEAELSLWPLAPETS